MWAPPLLSAVAAAVAPGGDGGDDGDVRESGDACDDDAMNDDGSSLHSQVLPSLQYHFPHQLPCLQNAFGVDASLIATGDKIPPCSGDDELHDILKILEVDSDGAGSELESTEQLLVCLEM